MVSPRKNLKVVSIQTLTTDVKRFRLEPLSPEDEFPIEPGQFLTLIFQNRQGQEERRSYSFSSVQPLEITVKRIPNGAWSRALFDNTQVGDLLATIGASGFFQLPHEEPPPGQIFFFAAGVGITPILPLIRAALNSLHHTRLVLIYSNRDSASTLFKTELDELIAISEGRLSIEYLESLARNLARARLSKWLLESLLKEYRCVPPNEVHYYLCGPFDYMRMVRISLLSDGVLASRIHSEDFVPVLPIQRPVPPDSLPHMVTILIEDRIKEIRVQYPETILSAALKEGIPMPYSCRAGSCGTCVAQCISGKVWMSYNEVLPDSEVQEGMVLTCTGYPIGGDLSLKV